MPSQSNVTEGKKTASRLLAREITLTPGLLEALRPTGNPERELSTAEKINLSEEPPRPKTPLPPPTPNPLLLPRRTLTLEEVMNTLKNTDIMVNKGAYEFIVSSR